SSAKYTPQTSHAFSKPAVRVSCLARLFHVQHSSEPGGPGTEPFHVEQSSCGSSVFHVSTGASQANLRWGFPHSDFVPRETYCNRMPVPGTGITFFVQRDEVGGPGTELFHVEQSCGSSLFHVRVRALDALPSGSSSLARGSETHSPEGLVLRRIPASQSNPPGGLRMTVLITAEQIASEAAGRLPSRCDSPMH